jgi:hypothetical protein
MAEADRMLAMYLHLARASHLRREPMVRDKLLVLAGVQAEQMGLVPISADCRDKILAHNARHIVRRWPTMGDALGDEHFHTYLKQLKRRYSPEKIEHMLSSLGIEMGREREAYFSDLEYATSLVEAVPTDFTAYAAPLRIAGSAGRSKRSDSGAQTAIAATSARRRALVVWGPFAVGLLGLAAALVALVRGRGG